jgi:hypothetical protein
MAKYLTVGDLREFLSDCNISDDAKVYITSNDEMPIRSIIDISSDEKVGYYNELYLDTVETGE